MHKATTTLPRVAEATEAAERRRDLDRLLTFVDAIAAIAITLLVLPLVELAAEVRETQDVGGLLREHSDELWSFALSFYVIARMWLGQHHAVSPLLVGNRRLTTLLVLWSFTIVVLPFPTSLVGAAGDEALTKVLYVATMAVSILLVAAHVGRDPGAPRADRRLAAPGAAGRPGDRRPAGAGAGGDGGRAGHQLLPDPGPAGRGAAAAAAASVRNRSQ